MNKLKNIIVIILLSTLIILGFNSTSRAYNIDDYKANTNPKTKESFALQSLDRWKDYNGDGKNDCTPGSNVYCIQHKQHMNLDDWHSYTLANIITIDGKKGTDDFGNVEESNWNAKLAAALHYSSSGWNRQDAIWIYLYDWMKNVGQKYKNIGMEHIQSASRVEDGDNTFSSDQQKQVENYVDSLDVPEDKQVYLTDNTNYETITVKFYTDDNKNYIKVGPLKFDMDPSLETLVFKDQDGNEIKDIKYMQKIGDKNKIFDACGDIKADKNLYLLLPSDTTITMITKMEAQTKEKTFEYFGAKIGFFLRPVKYLDNGKWVVDNYQNVVMTKTTTKTEKKHANINKEIKIELTGNLNVVKVDKDNNKIVLPNVEFKFKHNETGKWVYQADNGEISLVDEANAKSFYTDKEGKIRIEKLLIGTYTAYEKSNPNYGYVFDENGVEIIMESGETDSMLPNEQKYIKLSGDVWLDRATGKLSTRNDLFKDNDLDDTDILVQGVTVNLKEGDTVVKTTVTDTNGHYEFIDVETEKLDSYYIEFIYNGLTYTNVIPHIDKDNGSKAAENAGVRDTFNKKFSVVENSQAKDESGNKSYDLEYTFENHESSLVGRNDINKFPIAANTNETQYSIKNTYDVIKAQNQLFDSVDHINLGLYEKEQPSISVMKDIENVQISINGYNHRYDYDKRFENMTEESSGFNVGVKFGNEYGKMRYTRAIYKADYEWTTEDKTNELQVRVTYKIAIKNQSTDLQARVNSVVDYFDKSYSFEKAYDSNEDLNILNNDNINYNDQYNKIIIDTSKTRIAPQEEKDIYVTLKLSREKVAEILKDKEAGQQADEDKLLKNVAEINSYSIFDNNGNVYAGVDKISNPGSTVPGDENTYENDTDTAPGLQLEVAGARTASGMVFLDNSELKDGERLGSGAYENGEMAIPGVKVELRKTNGEIAKYYDTETKEWKDAVTETGEDGKYDFKGFIPDEYKIVYIWGDQTLTDGTVINVRDYKGTVYSYNRYNENQTNKVWYKGQGENDKDKRYTDAIDNYDMRIAIDNETVYVGQTDAETYYGKQKTNNTMQSETFTMLIPVEYSDMDMFGTSNGDRFEYGIENVDFGIVERAKQAIEMNKKVSSIKLTLANGEVVSDAIIEDGKLKGERKHLAYQGPNEYSNGFVKAELDNELIQGATIEIGYTISVTNNSEKDYATSEYYTFGDRGKDNIITITPSGIIDYLDSDWNFSPEKNSDWKAITLEELKAGDIVKVDESVYKIEQSDSEESGTDIASRIILYTDVLRTKPVEPGKTESVNLNVSKLLTLSDEIALNNETETTNLVKGPPSIDPEPGKTTITTHTGREIITIPGNYVPGTSKHEDDSSIAETVEVTPSTGEDRNYVMPIAIGLAALVVLGTGVILIKKVVLTDKK